MRSAFSSRLTPDRRRDLGRTLAQSLFDGASADSLEIFDGRDLRAMPRTRVWVTGGRAASRSGETLILTLPVGNGTNDELVAQLEAAPKPRRFPIDVAAVVGPVETVSEFRLKLPAGTGRACRRTCAPPACSAATWPSTPRPGASCA